MRWRAFNARFVGVADRVAMQAEGCGFVAEMEGKLAVMGIVVEVLSVVLRRLLHIRAV